MCLSYTEVKNAVKRPRLMAAIIFNLLRCFFSFDKIETRSNLKGIK
ncbi:MAG: hypothetical protein ACJAYB_002833 [Psychromonas sp.]|jgi:hypothetical protein